MLGLTLELGVGDGEVQHIYNISHTTAVSKHREGCGADVHRAQLDADEVGSVHVVRRRQGTQIGIATRPQSVRETA